MQLQTATTTNTVTRDVKSRLQIFVLAQADKRIAVEAARQGLKKGDIVSALAMKHLPEVDGSPAR